MPAAPEPSRRTVRDPTPAKDQAAPWAASSLSRIVPGPLADQVWSWTEDVALYALAAGARLADDLPFVYEAPRPQGAAEFRHQLDRAQLAATVHEIGVPLPEILHADETVRLHRPLPAASRARSHVASRRSHTSSTAR